LGDRAAEPRARARLRRDRGARPRDRRSRPRHRRAERLHRGEGGGGRAASRGARPRRVARLRPPGGARAHPQVAPLEGDARVRPGAADAPPEGGRDVMTAPAALGRLRDSRLPRILFVAHAFGGGIARHVEALARAIAGDAEVLLLRPHAPGHASLRWLRPGEDFAAWLPTDDGWDPTIGFLDAIGIDRVHYHHVHGWPQSILGLSRELQCAHDVTL